MCEIRNDLKSIKSVKSERAIPAIINMLIKQKMDHK